MVQHEPEEGWYIDPWGRHDARWMSAGQPTKLVRDGDVEEYEDAPNEPPTQTPLPVESRSPAGYGSDLLRADDEPLNAYEIRRRGSLINFLVPLIGMMIVVFTVPFMSGRVALCFLGVGVALMGVAIWHGLKVRKESKKP